MMFETRLNETLSALENRLFDGMALDDRDPFEVARRRLNVRVTWIFVIAGAVYSSSFIAIEHYFVFVFGVTMSTALLLVPYTIKAGMNRLRYILFFIFASFFIIVNLLGSGNNTSVPVVLWMVLTVQLSYVILTPAASIPFAALTIVVYMAKWIAVSRGFNFPYWIPEDIIERPRMIDFAAPVFYNLCLAYNSFRLSGWARQQILSSNEKMASLNKVVAETEKRNSLIVEESLAYISIHDRSGNLIFINKAAAQSLDYEPAELIGRPVSFLLDEKVRHDFGKYLSTVMAEGVAEGIMRVSSKSRKTLFWYYRNIRIDDQDEHTVLCFAQDVTELERTRQQLQKARLNAEESDRLKSLFLANISHEFRTPMNAIIGFSELLEKPNLAPDRRIEFTRHIRERGLNLLGMLNNLIDFSRLEAGAVKLHEIDGDVCELMDRVVMNIVAETTYLNQKDVRISKIKRLPEGFGKLHLDFFKLNQVLVNLVSNAIKFTNRGSITLTCELARAGVLQFSVADTGMGIPPEKLSTIFLPFQQASENIQLKYRGAGLGLAICKGFVQSWNGAISVKSIVGSGTVFTFTVPYKPAAGRRS